MARTSGETPPTCSIVIPVFNNCFYTRLCLGSLRSNRAAEPSYEIIVVDNGSTDGTAATLEHYRADVAEIVCNATNLGFAVASNQGSARARGKYLAFLNNDVVVEPGWLMEMVAAAESDPGIGAVGARLLYPDGTLQHAGVVFGPDRHPEHAFVGLPGDWPAALRAREYQAVTGACMLIERRLFESLAGFDERYFDSWEDVDLCFRIRRAGRRIFYCPRAVAFHFESVTAGRHLRDDRNLGRFLDTWGDSVAIDLVRPIVTPDSSSSTHQTRPKLAELERQIRHLEVENEHLRRLVSRVEGLPVDRPVAEATPALRSPRRDLLYRPGRLNLALAGREAWVPVALVNLSKEVLAPETLRLSYHWRRPEANKWEDWISERTVIDEPVEPGQTVSVVARVAIPNCIGQFVLEWDAVEEGVTWLSQEGVPPYRQFVTIRQAANGVATILDLPTTLEAGGSLSVNVQLAESIGSSGSHARSLRLRWVAPHQTASEVVEVVLDAPVPSAVGVGKEVRRAHLIVPSRVGIYQVIVGELQSDGAWLPLETVGGTTEIIPPASTGGQPVHREELLGDRMAAIGALRIGKPATDWQFLAEEAEYYRARALQFPEHAASELERQRSDELARLVEGYRNGRIMRGLFFLRRLWSAVTGRRRETAG